MTKYRGKHHGQTRGPYIRKAFIYYPNSEKELFDLSTQLNHFLDNKGYFINGTHKNEKEYSEISYSYHMAGATIGLTAMRYKIKQVGSTLPQCYLHLKLASNESLDDVIQKIIGDFPFFTEANLNSFDANI